MSDKSPNFIIVGLALFSMFFGSGNLIFPLMLGRDAGSAFPLSALGFILTAVMIPVLGVIAISFSEGDYRRIFAKIFRGKLSLILIFLILLSFIPFGAGPRCVVLAHASLKTFIPMPSLMIFAALFLSAVGLLVADRRHLIRTLGNILTPLLLASIAIMAVSAMIHGKIDPPILAPEDIFINSLFEGYNTQDLLSSLFFTSSLIMIMKEKGVDRKSLLKTMLMAGGVSVILLAGIYAILMAAASLHSDVLIGHSGIDLVSILAKHTMGQVLGLAAGIGVALACLTTAVALVMAFSQFLGDHILTKRYGFLALPITLLSIFFTTMLEFDGIMAIISPAMKIIYPLILLVVLYDLADLYLSRRSGR